jgi:alkaline phosphatase D
MSGQTTRRLLLAQAASLGAALAFGQSCAHTPAGPRTERRDLYPQGVASGDPAPDSVILWTRRAGGCWRSRLPVDGGGSPATSLRAHRRARRCEVSAATDWTCRFLAAA